MGGDSRVEAWINPYRLKGSASMPAALAENNLMNTHPEWVWQNPDNGSAYLNPAIPGGGGLCRAGGSRAGAELRHRRRAL